MQPLSSERLCTGERKPLPTKIAVDYSLTSLTIVVVTRGPFCYLCNTKTIASSFHKHRFFQMTPEMTQELPILPTLLFCAKKIKFILNFLVFISIFLFQIHSLCCDWRQTFVVAWHCDDKHKHSFVAAYVPDPRGCLACSGRP
jgi:hypothetical protein